MFDVQSDIALRVARALQLSLPQQERARIERLPTSNMAAYELYLKQRIFWSTMRAGGGAPSVVAMRCAFHSMRRSSE